MIRPDLHMHTTASDGAFAPSALARLLQRADITCFSVTDHDTLAGLKDAADAAYDRGLAFIPGVEISAEGEAEVHILGYGVRETDKALLGFLEKMHEERQWRIREMGEKLEQLGFSLPVEEILSANPQSVGRPHLARAMMERGYVESVPEAFDRYLGKGRAAYVPRERVSASQVIEMLKSCGAVPVLAHPGLLKWPKEKLLPMLSCWQDTGLMGLEVYHPGNRGAYSQWERLARQRGLMVTGGSDFHDISGHHGKPGETLSDWHSALEDAWMLFRAARK
ncbi:MAG: PHP domain-containing protein [Clostridiales bacterium]|nr:PHP domain-containing protein [Clostridiales bacterium]